MSISFKNTKHHTFSPSGTTTKIAEELSVSPLAIFLSNSLRLFGVIFKKNVFQPYLNHNPQHTDNSFRALIIKFII